MAAEMTKLKATLTEAQKHKASKEEDGQKYIKEARDDLQKICKVLLQKKIENEDLIAEVFIIYFSFTISLFKHWIYSDISCIVLRKP